MTVRAGEDNEVVADFLQLIDNKMGLLLESNRLATFKDWVFGDDVKCNAARLAEAGFYFIGTKKDPDSVRCYFCEKSLDCWSPDDDPWSEHLSHSPNCSFAQKQTGASTETVQAFAERKDELMQKVFSDYHTATEKKMKKKLELLCEELKK